MAKNNLIVDPNSSSRTITINEQIKKGRIIWNNLNEYFELTENCRFKNIKESPLAEFNETARIGIPNEKLLNMINSKCIVSNEERLQLYLNERPKNDQDLTVYLATTNKVVKDINYKALKRLKASGNFNTKIYAEHISTENKITEIKDEELRKLYIENYDPPNIELAIGSRVRITKI